MTYHYIQQHLLIIPSVYYRWNKLMSGDDDDDDDDDDSNKLIVCDSTQ
jgi:hypothetical protein